MSDTTKHLLAFHYTRVSPTLILSAWVPLVYSASLSLLILKPPIPLHLFSSAESFLPKTSISQSTDHPQHFTRHATRGTRVLRFPKELSSISDCLFHCLKIYLVNLFDYDNLSSNKIIFTFVLLEFLGHAHTYLCKSYYSLGC